jgi:NAD(P)-dependent dehydrogenase (short-subunit alcohol dehydrogenase family)
MNAPIVAVTGANRGIGYEIARQLAQRGARVILTARQARAGKEAAEKLKTDAGASVAFHVLDVTNQRSIDSLREFIEAEFKGLDVLINNAGIIADADADVLSVPVDAVRDTLETNTLAPLRLVQSVAHLLGKSKRGRVINVSSGMGALSGMGPDHGAYRLSKAALNAVTAMLATALSGDHIAVNSACPGWVRTDMGGANAERSVEQGADTPVWLALDAPQSLTGKFVRDRKVIAW